MLGDTMNKKGAKNSYIIMIIIFIVILVLLFVLLELSKNSLSDDEPTIDPTDPISTSSTSTTSTTSSITTTQNQQNNQGNSEVVQVENFSASLEQIANGLLFMGNYSVETNYSGVNFLFKCDEYDEESVECISGSATMSVNDITIPLYSYNSEGTNYLENVNDYYIILNDNYVVTTYNIAGSQVGEAKIYDRSGKLLETVDNVITGYMMNGKLYERLFPNITDNLYYFYSCSNNRVTISSINLDDNYRRNVEESVDGATCT